MKARSPVLGYNHNVRYSGRLWHVQTEDSGVQNPHVFTHLFHDGTILATKRLDYDPSMEVGAVQKLMQAQHKSMLRDLRAGAFDDKISKFLGEPVVHDREAAPAKPSDDVTPLPATPLPVAPIAPPSVHDVVAHAQTQLAQPSLAEPRVLPGPPEPFEGPPTDRSLQVQAENKLDTDCELKVLPPPPSVPALPKRPVLPPSVPPRLARPTPPPVRAPSGSSSTIKPPPLPGAPRPVPPVAVRPAMGIGGRRSATPSGSASAYGGSKPTAEGVVVARPAVIVGGDTAGRRAPSAPSSPRSPSSRWHTPTAPAPQSAVPPQPDKAAPDNIFGGDLISEKSLDEVILAYLSEDLNEK